MAWQEDAKSIESVTARFPEDLETDYVDPVLGRSLLEHLKTFWLIRVQHYSEYSQYYPANKVKQYLQPEQFTLQDWMTIATVCEAGKSWAYKQWEEHGEYELDAA